MKHKIMSTMMTALLLSSPLYANTDPAAAAVQSPAPTAAEEREVEPAMLLEQGMDRMLGFLNQQERPDRDALRAFLDNEVVPFFDFAYMAKSAAGPMYRYMEQEQRERMAENIQRQFLATMVGRLAGYDSQQLKVVSQRYGQRGNTAKVSVAVLQARGYPARLDFRFYRAKSGWKVFDVSANGQSAVIHYRRQFRQMMSAPAFERRSSDTQYQTQKYFRNPTSQ